MKVGEASNEVRKGVLETQSQQKLLRNLMKQTASQNPEGMPPQEETE